MKKVTLMSRLLLPLFFIVPLACDDDDDDDGVKVENHDKNEMMGIIHDMTDQMDAMQMTGDPDHDFASMMIMHHQGAINMGNKELEKGDVAELKTMAQEMIAMQQSEIQELSMFLEGHTPVSNPEGQKWDMEAATAMAKMKREADLQVITGDTDNDFAVLMVQHHQSALEMAQSILHHGHHDNIKEMANKMIEDQNMEIQRLQDWLLVNKKY